MTGAWTDVVSDGCICRWVNYSDSTGWFLKSPNPRCPHHGDGEHFREADLILTGDSGTCEYGCPHSGCAHEMAHLARAQVHATLALAAATALGVIYLPLPEGTRLAAGWNDAIGAGDPDEVTR